MIGWLRVVVAHWRRARCPYDWQVDAPELALPKPCHVEHVEPIADQRVP